MANVGERNQEFEEAINTDKQNYLSFFVNEFDMELDHMEGVLSTETSKILLSWVRDKLRKLHEDFNADL